MSTSVDPTYRSINGLSTGTVTRKEVVDALANYFGPIGQAGDVGADRLLPREILTLPEAYKGRSKFLMSKLEQLIVMDDHFVFSKLFPWSYTDELHVAWEVMRFDQSMQDLEPELGVPRIIASSTEARSDTLVRRGQGFEVEHGFWQTPQGRRMYELNLTNLKVNTVLTCAASCFRALLESRIYINELTSLFPSRTLHSTSNIIAAEVANWAPAQKTEKGAYVAHQRAVETLRRTSGKEPTLFVVPSGMRSYLALSSPFETEYYRRGPKSEQILESTSPYPVFRGTPVVESTLFSNTENSSGAELFDFLRRQREIGSHYVIDPKQDAGVSYTGDIEIFSMETDDFEKVSVKDAIEKCFPWDDARAKDLMNRKLSAGKDTDNLKAALETNSWNYDGKEWKIILFRPFQTYTTGAGILAAGEVGNTFYGKMDLQVADHASNKSHIAHWTYYSKAVVTGHENYVVLPDLFSTGYCGGEGTKIATAKSCQDLGGSWHTYSHVNERRLDGDIIAVLTYGDVSQDPISVSGEYPFQLEDLASVMDDDKKGDFYATASIYRDIYGLPTAAMSANPVYHNSMLIDRHPESNMVTFRGAYRAKGEGDTINRYKNHGHWGHTYPGCAAARCGEYEQLRPVSSDDK